MNFIGVLVGGIAVACALVELLPAEVLPPPDGGPDAGDTRDPEAGHALSDLPAEMQKAQPLMEKYGDDQKMAAMCCVLVDPRLGS
jgi:hypothetical protein